MIQRRITLFVLLCLAVLPLCAQQLPNSGFENFESDNVTSGINAVKPVSWNTSNLRRTVLGITAQGKFVYEEADGHTGKCVLIRSDEVGAAGITEVSPGWISFGTPWNYLSGINTGTATAGTDGGLVFSYRPDTLAVWVKRTYDTQEYAHIVFYSWTGTSTGNSYMNKNNSCSSTGDHYDEESDIRRRVDGNTCGTIVQATQVAEAMWRNDQQYPEWTEVKVPITYYTNDRPEKCNVILSASNYPNFRSSAVNNNARLYADDLRLIYSSKVHEILINNRSMAGVDPEVNYYEYALGANATSVPPITLKRSGRLLDPAEYTITYGGVGDTTTITVFAEDGSSQTTYSIYFLAELSQNARPSNITVDGTPISGFNPYIYNYNVELPYGTTQCPTIEVEKAEAAQNVTINYPASLPGAATIVVAAANTAYQQTYTINFTIGTLTDNTLTDIQVDGHSIPGFRPTTNNYTVELPIGTTSSPTVTWTTNYPDEQDIVLNDMGLAGGATISVTPLGTSLTRVYRLRYVVTASTYSYLQSIALDGVALEGFDPQTLSYTVTLPVGATELPAITYVQGDEYQTVVVEQGALDGVTKITVTAQSGAVSIYRITFNATRSTNSKLDAIYADAVLLPGFDPEQTDYTITLPLGSQQIPVITWTAADQFQTITYMEGSLTQAARIVVRAQSGASTTYTIAFVATQSTNTSLQSIMLDGVELEAFDPEQTEYSVTLPADARQLPVITWTAGDEYQIVRKNEGGVNGDTKITVRAQSGASRIYTIHFSTQVNSNTNLQSIMLDDVEIESFNPDTLTYSVRLAAGTTLLPAITWTASDASQTIVLSRGTTEGPTTITVRAQSGAIAVYTINFSVEKSANAFLDMIYVDGDSLADFDAQTLSYQYVLPSTATACPAISVDKQAGQRVKIYAPALEGTAKIEVMPEEGQSNIYTIDFHFVRSSNATLQAIYLDGQQLDEFDAERLDYDVVLPANATQTPAITVLKSEPEQTVYIQNLGIDQTSIVEVRAADGTIRNYTINFARQPYCNSKILSVSFDGEAFADFDEDTFDYTILLAKGTSSAPSIGYTLSDPKARAITTAAGLRGTSTIEVISECGSDTTTYSFSFDVERSSNNLIKNIYFNGTPLIAESSTDTIWQDLAFDAPRPVITYEKGDDEQSIFMLDCGKEGTQILVVAGDGSQYRYQIKYNIIPSSSSVLAGIKVHDGQRFAEIPNFASDQTEYHINLPVGAESMPAIAPVPATKGQTIQIAYGALTDSTLITVVSPDKQDTTIYTVKAEVEKSSVATLEAIYYNQMLLPAFDRDQTDYVVELPAGTTTAPVITFDYGFEESGAPCLHQEVIVNQRSIFEPVYVVVKAQNGDQTIYTVNFTIQDNSTPNLLNAILINGEAIEGFVANQFEYNLPSNGTIPVVSVQKAFNEQQVAIATPSAYSKTTIRVYAEGAATTEYVLNFNKVESEIAALTSISILDNEVPDFAAADTVYIVNLSRPITASDVNLQAATGVQASVAEIDNAHLVINATKDDIETNYTFFFHYPDDIIPNAGFDQWGTATYNGGAKPLGWIVPADCANSLSGTALAPGCLGKKKNFTTGDEVQNMSTYARLYTTLQGWESSSTCCEGGWTVASSIPGVITLGSMSIELKKAGASTVSISGGITYRNTPDTVHLDYNQIKVKGNANWRFVANLTGSEGTTQALFTDDYSQLNQWKQMHLPLDWSSVGAPRMLNITINSSKSDNGSGLGCTCNSPIYAMLDVDNLALSYSSKLAALHVINDVDLTLSPDNQNYTVNINPDSPSRPDVKTEGQVRDQKHVYQWLESEEYDYVLAVTSYAEDGTSTDYTFNFVRPVSSTNAINEILIDGVPLELVPDSFVYTVQLPCLTRTLPQIEVRGASYFQTIDIQPAGNSSVLIISTAENGDQLVYTLNFEEELPSEILPITIACDADDFAFDADTHTYEIELAHGAQLPEIQVDRAADYQRAVVCSGAHSYVKVYSADGLDSVEYTILFTRQAAALSSRLSQLTVNGENIQGFDPDSTNYSFDLTSLDDELAEVLFKAGSPADIVSETISDEALVLKVNDTEYTIELLNNAVYSASLSDIKYNQASLPEFAPLTHQYTLTRNNEESIEVASYTEEGVLGNLVYANDTLVVYLESLSGDSAETQIDFSFLPDTITTLNSVLLSSQPIVQQGVVFEASEDFNPYQTDYQITLISEQPKLHAPALPSIGVVKGSDYQTVDIQTSDNEAYVEVTAQSGASRIYTLTFDETRSSYSRLNSIAVNSIEVPSFDPDVLNYQITLGLNAQTPQVSYVKGDNYQTVSVETLADTITINVEAEDGTQSVYTIGIDRATSDVSTLQAIYSDGILVEGFDPATTNYDFVLPIGTTVLPDINVAAGDDGQVITITEGDLNGTTTIEVIASSGNDTTVYNLNYTLLLSTYNRLEMIYVNGDSLSEQGAFKSSSDFDAQTAIYEVTMPTGVVEYPMVTWTAGDQYQAVNGAYVDDSTFVIRVVPQDSNFASTYFVIFHSQASHNAALASILLNDVEIEGFDPEILTYNVTLPVGATVVPIVEGMPGDEWQQVTVNETTDVNGTATIVVLAGDAHTTRTYTVNFTRLLSSNNRLAYIGVNGEALADFDPDTVDYNVLLPVGTTIPAQVDYLQGDEYQIVSTRGNALNGDFMIDVTAENGDVRTYTIHFAVEPSHNALLQSISVNGVVINGFDPEIFTYQVELPYGTVKVPKIEYVIGEKRQTVSYYTAPTLADTARIKVVAHDRTTTSIYKIYFKIQKSTNALLSSITIGGEALTTRAKGFEADADFDPELFDYNIVLPYGTANLPEIKFVGQVADYTSITVDGEDVRGTTIITVVSHDGNYINEYNLHFSVRLNDNALLKDLQVRGNLLRRFRPDQFEYTIEFPIGTKEEELPTVDDITYERLFDDQTVEVEQHDAREIIVRVTAENGVSINVYVINFKILLSSNTLLRNIFVNEMPIHNFSPTQFEYTYYLFPGADLPLLEGEKSEESQVVDVTMGVVNGPSFIYVEAEDGTLGEYVVYFMVTDNNPGQEPSVYDVSFTPLGDGNFQFSSLRDNVFVAVYTAQGLRVRYAQVGLVDPNDNIESLHDGGTIMSFNRAGQVYIYVFYYGNIVLKSGKFIY